MTKVFKIKIGKHQTGIMDLDQVLEEMAQEGQGITDQQIGALMVEKLSKKNYIPPTVVNLYVSAFIRAIKSLLANQYRIYPLRKL